MAQLIRATARAARWPPAIRWLFPACLLLALLCAVRNVEAQGVAHSAIEAQVKAAYLYKFGNYVEWPSSTFDNPAAPLSIGVIDADALASELQAIVAGRTINGRPLAVRKLRRGDPLAGLNILFIGRADAALLAETLAAAKGLPILTVTESEDALAIGSMINFVAVDGKLRFEVAPKAAQRGNLAISARLLAVAYKVVSPAS
jgi:hypothetical protein